MAHNSGTHHVQVNVDETAMEMDVGFDGGGVITVLPEGAQAPLPAVVLLRGLTGDQLHAACDGAFFGVLYQQVNVVGGDHVIEYAQPKSLACFVEPAQVVASIPGEL